MLISTTPFFMSNYGSGLLRAATIHANVITAVMGNEVDKQDITVFWLSKGVWQALALGKGVTCWGG